MKAGVGKPNDMAQGFTLKPNQRVSYALRKGPYIGADLRSTGPYTHVNVEGPMIFQSSNPSFRASPCLTFNSRAASALRSILKTHTSSSRILNSDTFTSRYVVNGESQDGLAVH